MILRGVKKLIPMQNRQQLIEAMLGCACAAQLTRLHPGIGPVPDVIPPPTHNGTVRSRHARQLTTSRRGACAAVAPPQQAVPSQEPAVHWSLQVAGLPSSQVVPSGRTPLVGQ